MAYHYTESGLDNVYLMNGVTIHETPYGRGVSIHDTAGLHKALGLSLVAAPKAMNGAELRFLRLEMELTQRRLASMLGSEEQTLRRWEKSRANPIPGPADRLVRALYSEYAGGDGSVRLMIERLAELDQIDQPEIRMRETDRGWESSHIDAA